MKINGLLCGVSSLLPTLPSEPSPSPGNELLKPPTPLETTLPEAASRNHNTASQINYYLLKKHFSMNDFYLLCYILTNT